MQQTKTYNLKLIETSDTFSPEALNANAEALETHLARLDAADAAEQAARASADAAETARVDAQLARVNAALERLDAAAATIPKFTCGTYGGNSTSGRKIELPFTPRMVYVSGNTFGTINSYVSNIGYYYGGMALNGVPAKSSTTPITIIVEIVEGGFLVSHPSAYFSANESGKTYRYFAIG